MPKVKKNTIYRTILNAIQSSRFDLAALEAVVAQGFDLNHVENGRSLLDVAVMHDDVDVCQALVQTGKISQVHG